MPKTKCKFMEKLPAVDKVGVLHYNIACKNIFIWFRFFWIYSNMKYVKNLIRKW